MAIGTVLGQHLPDLEANKVGYDNTSTSAIIKSDNVQGAIDQLFTSVSNGKTKIAGAVTDKGVSTSGTDSFDVIAENIGKIPVGAQLVMGTIKLDGSNQILIPEIIGKENFVLFVIGDDKLYSSAYTPTHISMVYIPNSNLYKTGYLRMYGNPQFNTVQFRIDMTEFNADYIKYDKNSGKITINGNYSFLPSNYFYVAW